MEERAAKRTKRKTRVHDVARVMTQIDLARLGGGQVAYIKTMTADEARQLFPTIQGLPRGINLYSLHAADGTPIAVTDTRQAAIGQALEDELQIAAVH